MGAALFFPDVDEPGFNAADLWEPLGVCKSCTRGDQCLTDALVRGESYGIWDGIVFDLVGFELAAARSARAGGDHAGLVEAVGEMREETERFLAGREKVRKWVDPHECTRCGSAVGGGRHPPDVNGPRSTCGIVATYNKGCRCGPCKKGKSDYSKRYAARRSAPREATANIRYTTAATQGTLFDGY